LLVGCLLIIGLAAPSTASEPTLTPAQVVFQWLEWYPKNLPMAATLTTTSLRNGLSQQAWIEQHDQLLKDLQFKYLEAKVLDEEQKAGQATVTVKVRLFVVIGEVRQIERYTLKNVEGAWLIDDQDIQHDRVIGRSV
jgi:hypothetical protein